jgi:putative acetyltransferase
MVEHILNEARARNYTRLSLETGSFDAFIPARTLYANFGFQMTDPFADYELDPNSAYMTLELA